MDTRTWSATEVLRLAKRAYREGDAAFTIRAERQAYERGFKVVFGSDVTSTDDPGLQEAELMVLRKGFARVLSAEEIMQQLASDR